MRGQQPGPGYYEEVGAISKGFQSCSNYPSTLIKNFRTTEKRPEWHGRFKTPGPGTYRPPSDFGYLDMQSRINQFEQSQMSGFEFNQSLTSPTKLAGEINSPADKSI